MGEATEKKIIEESKMDVEKTAADISKDNNLNYKSVSTSTIECLLKKNG